VPFCPECGEEIEALRKVISTQVTFEFFLNNLGRGFYGEQISDPEDPHDPNYGSFQCPECGEELPLDTDKKAEAFLRGELPSA